MIGGAARPRLLATAVVAAMTASFLLPVSAAWAEDPESPALEIPLLQSEDPAPVAPSVPAGEARLAPLPPAPVEPLASAPPLPMEEAPPVGPGRTVYDATVQQSAGTTAQPSTSTSTSTRATAPTRSTAGTASPAEAAAPAAAPVAAVAAAPLWRRLPRATALGVVHGTPYSYECAL